MARASNLTIDVGATGVWDTISEKTTDYTILTTDTGNQITLTSGAATGDTTFTLIAGAVDKDTVWVSNQNNLNTKRLVISNGTDDVLYLTADDGVAKFVYSSTMGSWTIT